MSLSLTIGSDPAIDLDSLTDLENTANSTLLKLGLEFENYLNGEISAVPADLSSVALNYSTGNQTWTPGAGPLEFTLSGSVAGSITIKQSGDLFSYTDGFPIQMGSGLDTTQNSDYTKTISSRDGKSYVCLSLQFGISVAAGASYTSGIYGVSANGSASSTLIVSFYKEVASTTILQAAIAQAFKDFVLPLHPQTLAKLTLGDYLDYVFNANLQLSAGASISSPQFSYAGQYSGDVPDTAGSISGSVNINPSVQAGVKPTFSLDYGGTFEALLSLADASHASLHIYRSKTQTVSLDVNATLAITAGTTAQASVTAQTAVDAITKSLGPTLQNGIDSALSKYYTQITNWVTEVNNKLASWLQPLNNLNSSLDASITSTKDTYILSDYTIDLTQNYAAAWDSMIEGRFYDALGIANSGVSLSTGSGLESLYNKTASLTLNLFGDFTAQWTDALISNAQLIYVGNNVFHLTTAVGRQLLTTVNNAKKEIDLYFAADVDLSVANAPLTQVNLHVLLQAINNKGFGTLIANILNRLATDSTGTTLAGSVLAMTQLANATESLHFIFGKDAYTNIQASAISSKPNNSTADQNNYANFESACQALSTTPIDNFTYDNVPLDYQIWSENSIAANNTWPAPQGAQPDRKYPQVYNPFTQSQLETHFADIPQSDAIGITYALSAAAMFMNFCDDLNKLATQPVEANASTWNSVVATLLKIIKSDLSVDFIPSTALALAHICGVAPTTLSGPISSLPSGSSIGVTLTYGKTS